MIARDQSALSAPIERDLRLDLFRGIGLWMIFLDHIPHDVVAWLTLRNYGFSDAAEFFVFISGYLVGRIYGPIVAGGWFLAAVKRLWRRAAEMYVAHIMLFLLFTAQIARTARRFDNPMYEHEFNVFSFLAHPDGCSDAGERAQVSQDVSQNGRRIEAAPDRGATAEGAQALRAGRRHARGRPLNTSSRAPRTPATMPSMQGRSRRAAKTSGRSRSIARSSRRVRG